MSRVTEEIVLETKERVAMNMINKNKYSLEEIAENAELTLERVQELAGVKGA